jgi:hypothetical protein
MHSLRTSLAARIAPLVVLALLGSARIARAQPCHAVSYAHSDKLRFRAGVSAVAASYKDQKSMREYQGVVLGVGMDQRWVSASVSLPGYRLTRDESSGFGLGDLAAAVHVAAYRDTNDQLRAGAALAAMAPTGDADRGFGMGHVMLMPGIFLSLQTDAVQLFVEAAYGRALGSPASSHGTAHQHGASSQPMVVPVVNPMNRSELEHALLLEYRLTQVVALVGRLFGAVPVADVRGQVREVVGAGVRATFAPVSASLEVQVPIAGDPFRLRSVGTIDVRW